MKKLMVLLLAMALMMSSLSALADTAAVVKMSASDGSLHLRQGPGTYTQSVGYVKAGDTIVVYDGEERYDFDGEEWSHIRVDRTGQTGYIKTKYVSMVANVAANTVYVSQSGGSLNVRMGPGTNYFVAGYVQHGDGIEVLERGTTWSKVKVLRTGVTGYIKTQYIKGSSSTGGTTTTPATKYELATVMTKTAAGVVNLRKGAGTTYSSIAKLGRGTLLRVIAKVGDWYQVEVGDKIGYISATYVAFGVNAQTTANVNLRKGASTSYSVITTLKRGTGVVVHSVEGNWAKVTVGNQSGYVSLSYLKIAS